MAILLARPVYKQVDLLLHQKLPPTPFEIAQSRQLKRESVAANPPRLVIRNVEYVTEEDRSGIRYVLINEGHSRAVMGESAVTSWAFARNAPFPAVPPYEGGVVTTSREIEPAAEERLIYRDISHTKFDLILAGVDPILLELMLLGHIRYTDEFGTPHHLRFCRRRISGSNSFEPVDDPDYEHSH